MGAPSEAAILRKLGWAILPVACLMIGCCYLDRSNIAYMQLQLRRAPPVGLSFSPSLYGNASGLFFLSYSLFQIPSTLVVVRLRTPIRARCSCVVPVRTSAELCHLSDIAFACH